MMLSRSKQDGLGIRWRTKVCVALSVVLSVGSGCFSGDDGETFYGRVAVPRAQEFRWSDGGLPRVFDPARVSAPPDTDAVRALFEGLTDYDPQTLKPVAGVAARWEPSEGDRVWTFYLRTDARWSNGDPVTAADFVRSWRRTLRLGEDAPHAELLANVVVPQRQQQKKDVGARPAATPAGVNGAGRQERDKNVAVRESQAEGLTEKESVGELAAEAVNDQTLRVRLQRPDRNFPDLVAHPVFRPVHVSAAGEGSAGGEATGLVAGDVTSPDQLISNGAFRLREMNSDAVVLERENKYWNAARVALERVRFVGGRDAESALAAYRAGEVDAVTNARVEPLGLKLLASYKDFRRSTYGALTYYDFNATRPPFDDARVRQAMTRAIDRRRLAADTLQGAADPAESFLPARAGADGARGQQQSSLSHDPSAARRLLAEAGYPGGAGFPRVRLLVNRNDQHRRVADALAGMWRATLGIETEVLLRDWAEYETLLRTGEYDVARRSLLMQTNDEETIMRSLFDPKRFDFDVRAVSESEAMATASATPSTDTAQQDEGPGPAAPAPAPPVLTEAQALREVPALPVYFAMSYSLVKPYVLGFDANVLDAPSLQRVRIDTNWQAPKRDPSAVLRTAE